MQLLSIIVNAAIAVLSPTAWLMLVFGAGDPKQLASRGLSSLKYFTVLSNLFSGLVSAVYVVVMLGGATEVPLWLAALKLDAATAVSLTFFTVIVLLGPTFGWKSMYAGGNLWMHLLLPLMAILDCLFLAHVGVAPFWTSYLAVIPTLAYGLWYLHRVDVNGVERDGEVYDHYGFYRWGRNRVPAVAMGMLLASWLIALGILLASRVFM